MPAYLANIIIALTILEACTNQLFAAPHATATLSPSQGLFVSGEPIDLVLTLHNDADTPAFVSARYPTFFGYNHTGGITFSTKGRALSTPNYEEIARNWEGPPGLPHGPAVTWQLEYYTGGAPYIDRRKTWSAKIFLQQFTDDLEPGDYEFTYSVDIASGPSAGIVGKPFRGAGTFRVTIVKGTEAELSAALVRHAKHDDDYWSARSAVEGLLLVHSQVVIPYLTRIKGPDSEMDRKVIVGMAKFKGNHDAETFVLDKLRSDDGHDILAALAVLQRWNYVLPEREMWRLLNLPPALSTARIGAIVYAAGLPSHPFRSQVRALVNDPDKDVAETAARAYPITAGDHPIK